MIHRLAPQPTPARAAAILREVFGGLPRAFAFRLWDGTEVTLGPGMPVAAAVIKSREAFVQLMRDPSPGNFAEAYRRQRDRSRGRPLRHHGRGERGGGGPALVDAESASLPLDVETLVPEHDTVVVGGGPGGSTAAWSLARAGLHPLVLDAAVFPRVKICAGWVTRAALADLEVEADKYPLTIQPFRACVLEFEAARHETDWRRPASYGIIRREFDHYLLERAAAAGADVRWGVRVKQVSAGPAGVRIETDRGVFEAPVVIGAGGHRCPVAKALGEVSESACVVAAQESATRLAPEWAERLRPFMAAGCTSGRTFAATAGTSPGVPEISRRGRRNRRRFRAAATNWSRLRAPGRLPAGCPSRRSRARLRRAARRASSAARASRLIGDAAGSRGSLRRGHRPSVRAGRLAAGWRPLLRAGTPLDSARRSPLYSTGGPAGSAASSRSCPMRRGAARRPRRPRLERPRRRPPRFQSIFGMGEGTSRAPTEATRPRAIAHHCGVSTISTSCSSTLCGTHCGYYRDQTVSSSGRKRTSSTSCAGSSGTSRASVLDIGCGWGRIQHLGGPALRRPGAASHCRRRRPTGQRRGSRVRA